MTLLKEYKIMVRSVAANAHEDLLLDNPLSPAARVDLCIETDNHWRALQDVVRNGATPEDLDRVIGQFGEGSVAKRMKDLIAQFAPRWSHIQWQSDWDIIATIPE